MHIFDSDIHYNYINSPLFNDLYVLVFGYEKCSENKLPIGPKQKNCYFIHYILSGRGILELENKTYHLSADDVFLISPNAEHYYRQDPNDPWSYIWIEFSGAKAKFFCENSLFTKQRPIYHCNNKRVAEQLTGLFEYEQQSYTANLNAVSHLLKLFAQITEERNPPAKLELSSKERTISIVQQYIMRNFTNPNLSLIEISNVLFLNPNYLSRTFKEQTGINISQFIISVRLQHARELLSENKYSINEIALKCGYSDYHYFTVQFKKHVGTSPSHFIKDAFHQSKEDNPSAEQHSDKK